MSYDDSLTVLYSFPHKLGADRICHTAWQQVDGLAKAGANVRVMTGALARQAPSGVEVHTTLALGKARIPYRVIGTRRACALHDWFVARSLRALAPEIDIVHTWPLGALHTLRVANELRIPTVLERPNAHTKFAFRVVQQECERLGVTLPANHEHAYKADVLRREEAEYALAKGLLCPSEFVKQTFVDEGFHPSVLYRHQYGYDHHVYYAKRESRPPRAGLTVLYVGVCAVRKGLHFGLEAWLRSSASRTGQFLIAGAFVQDYAQLLRPMLVQPGVRVLGHRDDIPELMRDADIFILPTIEEGSPLASMEAIGSGAVPVVSDVCRGACRHMENSLIHPVADVEALTQHLTLLHDDRGLLRKLRAECMRTAPSYTWERAGERLFEVYRSVIRDHQTWQEERKRSKVLVLNAL